MTRLRFDFQVGTLSVPVSSTTQTSLTSTAFQYFPVVASPDYAPLTINPQGNLYTSPTPEIVWITAHAASSSIVTVTRAQEGTTAQTFPVGTQWSHTATELDYATTGGQGISSSEGIIALNGTENVNIVGASGSSVTLPSPSVAIGNDITLSANCTVTMPAVQQGDFCYCYVQQVASGSPYTITFSGVNWTGGIAPVMSTSANAVDRYDFVCRATQWYGTVTAQGYTA